ncbi:FAD-dependent oxidoreductase [Paenibacillus contaminans]|uniref:FAD-dependent oxidoreductase n=1 Tax=Paenibacillus contaminans TaxID=450362 RepID=A0A329MNU3_9BACL|nr:FAD-dependent oxidoreductase [Paenibacillus contaminans]RAV21292.1 FAD-dependent oxidoreductase [Paenibacillus contaminans]
MGRYRYLAAVLSIVMLGILAACKDDSPEPPVVSKDGASADVVVVGSELEGMYLAKAAKEEGLSVVILDPREKPGGQLIQGEMQFLDEPQDDEGKTLLQGQVKTLFDGYKSGKIRKAAEFEHYYRSLLGDIPIESGIKINGLVIDPDEQSPSLKKLNAIDYQTKDGKLKRITASYVVDNTDFAAITSRLGLPRIPGIESVFGGEREHMAATIMMKFKNVDWKTFKSEVYRLSREEIAAKYGGTTTVTDYTTWGFGNTVRGFQASDKRLFLRGLNIVNQRDGDAAINALLVYGVDPSSETSVKEALEMGIRETEDVLKHLRKELPGWEKAEINGYPDYLYIRDFDRYETEYVLQASDIMRGTMFWDNVSVAGYPIDLQGTLQHYWGSQKGKPDKYGIPLRSFISKGYSNVLVAGKNVGATGAAYGSARIQPNTSLAGEVIGIILGQIKGKYGIRDIDQARMKELVRYVGSKGIALDSKEGNDKIRHLTEEELKQLDYGSFEVKK